MNLPSFLYLIFGQIKKIIHSASVRRLQHTGQYLLHIGAIFQQKISTIRLLHIGSTHMLKKEKNAVWCVRKMKVG